MTRFCERVGLCTVEELELRSSADGKAHLAADRAKQLEGRLALG
jgi:hypothetical protein